MLICCSCGMYAKGKQRYNRDHGYGICARCANDEIQKLSYTEMESCYGKYGVNYFTEQEFQEVGNNHLNVCLQGLLREANSRSTPRARDKFAQNWGVSCYAELCSEVYKMENKGWEVFTVKECDNVDEKGRCGGHKKRRLKAI